MALLYRCHSLPDVCWIASSSFSNRGYHVCKANNSLWWSWLYGFWILKKFPGEQRWGGYHMVSNNLMIHGNIFQTHKAWLYSNTLVLLVCLLFVYCSSICCLKSGVAMLYKTFIFRIFHSWSLSFSSNSQLVIL